MSEDFPVEPSPVRGIKAEKAKRLQEDKIKAGDEAQERDAEHTRRVMEDPEIPQHLKKRLAARNATEEEIASVKNPGSTG